MSSASFRQIGKASSLTTIVRSLAAEYQRFAAKSITIETTDFKSRHRTAQSLLKYNELALQAKKKPITTQFYSPLEPDFKNVVLMLNLDQMGRYAVDSSGWGNRGKIAGAGYAPQIVRDDGIDVGYGINSEYLFFDGYYTFVYVEDAPNIRARQINTSMCFTFRIYLYPGSWMPSDPDDISKPRYIFAKADDAQQQSGYACALTPDGRIKFTWRSGGVSNTIQTDDNTITLHHPGFDIAGYTSTGYNTDGIEGFDPGGFDYGYQIGVEDLAMFSDKAVGVFNVVITASVSESYDADGYDSDSFLTGADGGLTIAIDSAFLTGSTSPVITYYTQQTGEHLDLFIGNQQEQGADDIDDPLATKQLPNHPEYFRLRIGAAYPFSGDKQTWYKYLGGIQDFKIYRDRLLTAEEIQFLFLNKLTISPIPFGQVAKAGYVLILPSATGCCGYSAEGYDSVGFDTGL